MFRRCKIRPLFGLELPVALGWYGSTFISWVLYNDVVIRKTYKLKKKLNYPETVVGR